MKIAVFYHCLFMAGDPPELLPAAGDIIYEQMVEMVDSGLMDAADEFHVGINGGQESEALASMFFPEKAKVTFHGLDCKNENRTIQMIERWVPTHPDWAVLYFHCKGATHPPGNAKSTLWRNCLMRLVHSWRVCLKDLETDCDSVGVHWMTGSQTPPGQSIWAGNFFWAKSDFLATLPKLSKRARIRESGIGSPLSRYEAECWIGNGSRLPVVMDYHPVPIVQCAG